MTNIYSLNSDVKFPDMEHYDMGITGCVTGTDYYDVPFHPYFETINDVFLECDIKFHQDGTIEFDFKNCYNGNSDMKKKYEKHISINNLNDTYFSRALSTLNSQKSRFFMKKQLNPDFKPFEFDGFKKAAGTNAFTLSPKKWIESTNAIGIVSKSGRYGGTFAHSDIAF